ncbi:MAG: dioxygenase [Actinobacteria bacterium]|jgi:uncharacterized protein|nr:dioxygenase [Actinomycetota bacterium]
MGGPILHLSIPVVDLDATHEFYVGTLGLERGRVRESWFDVWFFGMQLSLQLAADTATVCDNSGMRHFGVTLPTDDFEAFVSDLETRGVKWLSPPTTYDAEEFSSKRAAFLVDPSGNVLEIKTYGADDTWARA